MIRDFTQKNNPITCPNLLDIECGYCHDKGHTTKYCQVLKAKKDSSYEWHPQIIEKFSDKKRALVDKNGFVHIPVRSVDKNKIVQNKVQKMNVLIGAYAALNVEGSDEDDDVDVDANTDVNANTDVELPPSENIDESTSVTWAKIVSTNGLSNQTIKDRLGIRPNSRWADEDE